MYMNTGTHFMVRNQIANYVVFPVSTGHIAYWLLYDETKDGQFFNPG